MTPEQFLQQISRQEPAAVYLFIGPDLFYRDRCRAALLQAVLGSEDREQGYIRHDLDDIELSEALDDARSLSLFATRRVIWISGAEAALPKGRLAESGGDEEGGKSVKGDAALVEHYVRHPSPGTVVVFDSSRHEFDAEDRTKIERVQKFYGSITNQVEFRACSIDDARRLAEDLARQAKLQIGPAEIGLLVEALAADASRIAAEIEKLSLYAGGSRRVTADDIARLTPNARENTIFELVAAMGAGNRAKSLTVLDSLVRDGEYLPLALSFLATQFRMALMAREAGLRTAGDIQAHFTRAGVRIWRDRAEQVRQTLQAFSKEKLELALKKMFTTDRALRDARPDDRVVMEELILSLTGG